MRAPAKITILLRRRSSSGVCFYNKFYLVHDIAFWRAIEILAEDRSEENMKKMKRLKEEIGIGDADGDGWSTIVESISAP